jgi:hypothetical protein
VRIKIFTNRVDNILMGLITGMKKGRNTAEQ